MDRSRRGLFIVFEGVNGSSKTSTICELSKYALKYGKIKIYKFPDRSGHNGKEIDTFLKKQKTIKSTYDRLDIFAKNRYAYMEEIIRHLEEGTTILCDRYIYSAIVYQLPVDRIISDIELYATASIVGYFDKHCIQPDLIFLMDADFLSNRKDAGTERYHYDSTQQNIVRSYFKRVMTLCDTEYYIIQPTNNCIHNTACDIMNIIDNRSHTLSHRNIRTLYEQYE